MMLKILKEIMRWPQWGRHYYRGAAKENSRHQDAGPQRLLYRVCNEGCGGHGTQHGYPGEQVIDSALCWPRSTANRKTSESLETLGTRLWYPGPHATDVAGLPKYSLQCFG